ncbi:MAG: tyrosine-type recombinase/integrase [Gemmataceae bacterium]
MPFLTKITITRYIDPTDPKKKRRATSSTPGAIKKTEETRTYYIVDKSDGKVSRVNTGMTDKRAAEKYYADWLTAKERGQVGLTDPYKQHKDGTILDHLADHLKTLRANTRSTAYHEEVERELKNVFKARHDDQGREVLPAVKTLRDLTAGRVQQYLDWMTAAHGTKNKHRTYLVGFFNFLVAAERLPHNPITKHTVRRAKPKGEAERRRRRAMRVSELRTLVQAAYDYPVKAATMNTGGRPRRDGSKAEPRPSKLSTDTLAALMLRGRERRLLYRLAILTGLRRGELSRLRVRHLIFGKRPRIELPGVHTKNGRDAKIPLVPALAVELKAWVEETGRGKDDPVVTVPQRNNLLRAHKAQLKLAGIVYQDDRGRFADFHSIRTSLNVLLRRKGVPLRERQLFLRQAAADVTTNNYDDERMTKLKPVMRLLAKLGV